mmetsp:Transcript_2533/g.6940  ORF Transcript_2533/g.6940 Transcript_2533/m.6940 type:complete len:150 (-) Transcript_2533:760-1209(-)
MSVQSQRSFDPEADNLSQDSYDPESADALLNRSMSERSFDPECTMPDDGLTEASFDPDHDLMSEYTASRRFSTPRSTKSFDPETEERSEQDLTGFEVDGCATISARVAQREFDRIREVAAKELERLRIEVMQLRESNRRECQMYDYQDS